MLAISLGRCGSRWITTTKAAPGMSGRLWKNRCSVCTPPADAPIPTTMGLAAFSAGSSLVPAGLCSFIAAPQHGHGIANLVLNQEVFVFLFIGTRGAVSHWRLGDRSSLMANRDILAIGTSAGGVDALRFLVSEFPKELPASVLVVIHLSPQFQSSLDAILTQAGPLPARFAEDGMKLECGQI